MDNRDVTGYVDSEVTGRSSQMQPENDDKQKGTEERHAGMRTYSVRQTQTYT